MVKVRFLGQSLSPSLKVRVRFQAEGMSLPKALRIVVVGRVSGWAWVGIRRRRRRDGGRRL